MKKASKFTYLHQNNQNNQNNNQIQRRNFEEKGKKQRKFQEIKKQEQNQDDFSDSSFDSEEDLDTNVIALEFDILKNTNNIAMGDPVQCEKCQAILNKYSKILNAQQFLEISGVQEEKNKKIKNQLKNEEKIEKQEQEENKEKEEKNDKFQIVNKKGKELGENESVWICEFCGNENVIMIEEEEIPKQEDVIYLTQANQLKDQQNEEEDTSIIFCLDNSGSMSVTSEVKGKKINLKHGLTQEEYDMLKQFMDQGDEQQLNQQQNVTYISRKQCVLTAIQQQLQDMQKQKPNKKVGIVTFSDEVVIIGDGHAQEPTIITGDKLYKQDSIENTTIQKAQEVLKHSIENSIDKLTDKFSKLQEKGRTALGPALLASIMLAGQGKPGSMVVICTDGLANIGLGALEYESDEAKQFYQILSEKAKNLGIVISVITIKGEGCKVEILGKLAEETNGTVTRVDPTEIEKDFAAVLGDEVSGTKVELQFQLHKALKFRKEEQQFLKENGSLFQKHVGNVTVNTKMTFEYSLQSDEFIQQYQIDIQALKEVPLQARIYYNSQKGDRYLRVLTQTQKTTFDKKEAERELEQVDVIHDRIIQQSAQLLQKGRLKSAQQYNSKWSHYVMDNDQMNSKQQVQEQNYGFGGLNKKFKKMANNVVQKSKNLFSSNSKKQTKKDQSEFQHQQQQSPQNMNRNRMKQQLNQKQNYDYDDDDFGEEEQEENYQITQNQNCSQQNPYQSASYIYPNNESNQSVNSFTTYIRPQNYSANSSQISQQNIQIQNKEISKPIIAAKGKKMPNTSQQKHLKELSTIKEQPYKTKKVQNQNQIQKQQQLYEENDLYFSASEGSDFSDDDIQANIINYKQARKR
ncbi:hypothetical protein PPERSA_11230 [Pseudocohnilembus persalinus]|uniref:VWFA domain-containing protein n=1 Tax=Pseudocohnilembus persalinus TaxID=266149 RepID=A0A0V0QZM9_PSEPJ|nr:hypothetical protein PPERSA_11230 [Pseudocohnilembus persalinus]|eukprot:KRX07681.1 hypothetical protein PPERSA_11230 [Pseudocohnilembus persalinus]